VEAIQEQLKGTQSGHARLVFARDATAWGCSCVRAGGCTRLT